MDSRFNHLVHAFAKRYASLFGDKGTTVALQLPGCPLTVFGDGEPAATLFVNDQNGIAALSSPRALLRASAE